MESILKIAVVVSACLTAGILTFQVIRTIGFGRKPLLSKPSGDWRKGVFYAFGQGMMPWEKESAKNHLVSYAAGFGYHFGIFSALFYLFTVVAGISLPSPMLLILRLLMIAGLVFGLGLLLKRTVLAAMRWISVPDDFIANMLVDGFIVLALIDSLNSAVRIPLLIASVLVLLYIPIGKIRHCFFFFYSRILFGHFYGRRGVFPHDRIAQEGTK